MRRPPTTPTYQKVLHCSDTYKLNSNFFLIILLVDSTYMYLITLCLCVQTMNGWRRCVSWPLAASPLTSRLSWWSTSTLPCQSSCSYASPTGASRTTRRTSGSTRAWLTAAPTSSSAASTSTDPAPSRTPYKSVSHICHYLCPCGSLIEL